MYVDPDRSAFDIPVPPSIDELATAFALGVITFAPQPGVEESSGGRATSTSNGALEMEAISLSYTLWRYPEDRNDPRNLRQLSAADEAALAMPPVRPLPQWLLDTRDRMRYPQLWEAVRTTKYLSRLAWQTLESELLQHANYILMNIFRETRMEGEFPGTIVRPLTEADIRVDRTLTLDGVEIPAIEIDFDADVYAIAADLGERFVTIAIPRDDLTSLRLAFVTRLIAS